MKYEMMARCRWTSRKWGVSCGIGENGKVGGHGDVTVDRSGSGILDGGWN